MCGTREILNAGNLLEHVTRLRTISMNFSNIHRVGQVSVSKLHKKRPWTLSSYPTTTTRPAHGWRKNSNGLWIIFTHFFIYFFFIDLILQSFGLYNTITIWTLICSCRGKKWHYFYIFIFKEIILVLIFRRKKIILIRSSVHNVLLSEQQYENHSIYLYEIGKFSVRMYIFILATN